MVVVSSSTLAEECFTKNDIVLANRPETSRGKHLGYNHTSVLHSSYGDHWRNLRRIGAIEIFSSSRMNAFTSVRKDEIRRLIMKLSRNSRQGHFVKVEMKSMLNDLTLNNIMRMAAGKRYCGDGVSNEEETREFKELMAEIFETGGIPNPADFFPRLKLLGEVFEKRDKKQGKRLDGFMQKLIDEHRSYKRQGIASNSMIDHLLSLQESEPHLYTDQIIKGVDGKEIDMMEGIGLTMPKAQPLEALCKARPIVDKALPKKLID
ncbi:Cytochrome P450 [Corchorus olitorius]|uniref:Cytochrome P450 n=1 Tax=Corchorus olitorius TaxID=93759 RepID=A0A1R3KAF7_9ROSI|nr:Cytochrome P450 [Corchorus olitorius]